MNRKQEYNICSILELDMPLEMTKEENGEEEKILRLIQDWKDERSRKIADEKKKLKERKSAEAKEKKMEVKADKQSNNLDNWILSDRQERECRKGIKDHDVVGTEDI